MDKESQKLLERVSAGEFTFVDLGCGTGESISYGEKVFGRAPGVGFDISERKITAGRAQGHPLALADVTKLSLPDGCVSFITMMDFLEHLFSIEDARNILRAAGQIANDFLFIRHPSFEDIEYLAELNLKAHWSDWTGHYNMMRISEFETVFAELGWSEYVIIPQKQIVGSYSDSIVPLSAPTNTTTYDQETLGPKPQIYFTKPVFTQFDIFVKLNPNIDRELWDTVLESSLVETKLATVTAAYLRAKEKRSEAERAYQNAKERLKQANSP